MFVVSEPATRDLAGIPLRMVDPKTAAEWVCQIAVESSTPTDIHLVNAYTIALANHDHAYRDVLCRAVVNFPDGRPLATVTKYTTSPLQQVRGPGLFENVMDTGRRWGVRHYLLGSTEDTIKLLEAELKRRYPGVQIVGSYCPPFRQLTEAEKVAQDDVIRESGATIVWVGLGTPKQDLETQRIASSVSCVVVAVGAAFDFVAGTKREAPRWIQHAGFEWLFRLASEPRRLWKRYLIGNLGFIHAVLKVRGLG